MKRYGRLWCIRMQRQLWPVHAFEEVARKLNIEDLVDGIPVEQQDCTEGEYIEANQSLWRALTMGADSTITTARRNVQRGCGIDLLIVLDLKII